MSARAKLSFAVIALIALLLFLARMSIAPSGEPVPDRDVAETPPAAIPPAARSASSRQVPNRTAPQSAAAAGATAETPDAGQLASPSPAMFGRAVTLVQGFALGEALSKNAANADAYVDRLCAESRSLREWPALRGSRKHDAAAFMAPLIDYERPLDDPPGRLHLPDELRERITSYGSDWPIRISDRDLAGLDFSWMVAIAQFDHWTVLGAGRLRDVPVGNIFRDPLPNYVSLMLWSKLRFALGLRRGDLASASAEVRHLADLIRSQGILLAEMVAVALYKMEARARELAAAAGADVSGMGEFETNQLERYRRTTFGSIFFTFPGVRPETVKKALDCMPSPCVALAEGAGANRSFGAYGATDNLPLLREIASAHACEEALIARAVDSQEIAAGDALEGVAEDLDAQSRGSSPRRADHMNGLSKDPLCAIASNTSDAVSELSPMCPVYFFPMCPVCISGDPLRS